MKDKVAEINIASDEALEAMVEADAWEADYLPMFDSLEKGRRFFRDCRRGESSEWVRLSTTKFGTVMK